MGKTLNENETMFKVCLANGKCEEFKPYNLNEISIIFRTMAIRNPYDVHPVYLSHDKHLYWNVVKFLVVAHRQYEYYLNHLLGIVSLYLGHI